MYVDVLLPLAIPGAYTYTLPPEYEGLVGVGSRIIVPLGKSKRYSAIVIRLHDTPPKAGVTIRPIEEVIDERPLLVSEQIDFWRWLADYYMCTPGEVMKAALPSGLKLESETAFALAEGVCADDGNDEAESAIIRTMKDKQMTLGDLQKGLKQRGIYAALRRLVETQRVYVEERMARAFRAKTEVHLRLANEWLDEAKLGQLIDALSRSPRQQQVLLAYLDLSDTATALTLGNTKLVKEVSRHDLVQKTGKGSEAAVTQLRKRGVLEAYDYEVGRLKSQTALPQSLRHKLSDEQQRAYTEILDGFESRNVVLLHGVTSSGKTEVYICLIEETLAQGKQVLYMLPEIALTTQIMTRLGRVFGNRMGVYHSKFPDAERVELWQKQLTSEAYGLILGVRSSIFLPYRNLGLIIVDEEHETSYKQQDPAPRYHARDAAIMLARLYGAKVLLGTATPSLESYSNAQQGKYGLVEMLRRFGDVKLPEIIVEDVAYLRKVKRMRTPFAPGLIEQTREALGRREQAIFFQNRRGYSPVLECHTCGWVPKCTQCDVSLTLHQKIHKMVCHYCGSQYEIPDRCPNCESSNLRDVGYGTEKIESAVEAVFPEAKPARMDLDTTRARSSYEHIIEDFAAGRTNLLIGTQMVTKGLDFEGVSTVGILCADQMLATPDFRAHERAFQMLSQVAGRAGRRGKQGRVFLQTKHPEEEVVRQIVRNDYRAMYDRQIAERRQYRFPPFVRIIDVYLKHRNEQVCETAARVLAEWLRPLFGADLLGPDRPAVARIQLLYIRKLMLKVDNSRLSPQQVRATLNTFRAHLLAQPDMKGINIYFDVDPQ